MISSPVLDYLIRIKNASLSGKKKITVPYSKFKADISTLLQKNGLITSFEEKTEGNKKDLEVTLKYENRQPLVSSVCIISRPGRRMYYRADGLPWGKTPKSLILISTGKGVISQKQAHKLNIGGEVIAEVY